MRHTLGQHTAVTRAANGDILAMYGDFTDQMEGQTGYLVRSRATAARAGASRSWRCGRAGGAAGTHTSLGMQTLGDGRILLPWTPRGEPQAQPHGPHSLRVHALR